MIKRTLKALFISFFLFLMLTMVLAAVLRFTAFDEDWTFAGLMAVMSIVTFVLGLMTGTIAGKRGLLTGMAAAVVFILAVLLSVRAVFAPGADMEMPDLLYVIPLLAGAVGGILGANRNKS